MKNINHLNRLFWVLSLSLIISSTLGFGFLFERRSASAFLLAELRQTMWVRGWHNLFGKRRPVPPPPVPPTNGGSRPTEEVCPIAPLAVSASNSSILTTAIVWSDRPTFVWNGSVQKIGVRVRGSEDILWSEPVSGTNHVSYKGEPLQPNRVYEWLVLSSNDRVKRFIPFRIVTAQDSDRINQALQQLNQQLAAEKITGEAATLRRAEFFANQKIDNQPLWSEFWQEVLSVQTPSDKLTTWTRETVTLLCKPVNAASNRVSPSR